MKFLIKYATRGRSEYFKKAILNIINTIGISDYWILVTADWDDPSMNSDDIMAFVSEHSHHVSIKFGTSESKIHAINRDMGADILYSYNIESWDILVNMSDDMLFVSADWGFLMEKRIKEVWDQSLDFFAHFNDGYVGDKLPTMSIMGRWYYERDGYIYYPEYKSFSCDAEAMFVAMHRGRHHYFSEVLFLHQHPTHSPMPQDETYRVNSLATPHDVALYWRRLNSNFGLGEDIGPTIWDEHKTNKI